MIFYKACILHNLNLKRIVPPTRRQSTKTKDSDDWGQRTLAF